MPFIVPDDLDIWPWPSNSPERGTKHVHVYRVNLAQICTAVPEIFHTQTKKTHGAKNSRTIRSSVRAVIIDACLLTALQTLMSTPASRHSTICCPVPERAARRKLMTLLLSEDAYNTATMQHQYQPSTTQLKDSQTKSEYKHSLTLRVRRCRHSMIATKPVHRLQIRPLVHN